MNNKILYVEDDATLAFLVKDNLEMNDNFTLCHYNDGMLAKKAFAKEVFDLCLIDVMLPSLDGFSLAEHIREQNSQVPIIFLTAKSMQEDKLAGLKIGADDYITKPFNIEELILKINIFLKRKFINATEVVSDIKIGNFLFDPINQTLTLDHSSSKLTQRECELLILLAQKPNEVITRKNLLERVWGKEDYFLGRSMDVFISRLRKYLSADPSLEIENIHGVGFRLNTLTTT